MNKMKMQYIYTLIAFLFLNLSALASSDIYTVENVVVDVKAESAVAAEQKAVLEARMKAFSMLIERLVPEDQRGRLSPLSAEAIEPFVDGFEVKSQKNSKVRYMATMTFYFDGKAVQQYLGKQTVAAVESSAQPLVVVPVFIDKGGIFLWGEQNPWLEAWSKREHLSKVTPIVVPLGDLKDIAIVDGKQIIDGEISGVRELSRRYGGAGVVIVILRRDSTSLESAMSYEARVLGINGDERSIAGPNAVTSPGDPSKQFNQAIDAIIQKIESHARNQVKSTPVDAQGLLLAVVPLNDAGSWMKIQQILNSSSEIQRMTVKGLSRRQATVEINYRGTIASLESALHARGLKLEQLDGQKWVITATTGKTSTPY
ncbi:MAG: DUF2066 domain-containing protein [Alphaproteobacteria bacterium]|nr:DUF2066 domain-containing protein [Alphaproteobacteria bacterium]